MHMIFKNIPSNNFSSWLIKKMHITESLNLEFFDFLFSKKMHYNTTINMFFYLVDLTSIVILNSNNCFLFDIYMLKRMKIIREWTNYCIENWGLGLILYVN